MKKILLILISVGCMCLFATAGFTKEDVKGKSGEEMFKENCSVCHPNGGDIIDPDKTLHKEDLDENNVKKPEDIVKLMRNPGPGMERFDEKAIPDEDARKIAEYILKTFK